MTNGFCRAFSPAFLPIALLVLGACTGADDSGGLGDRPDITGHYNVIVKSTSGCDGDATWIAGWASGPLSITGAADALTFDFGGGMSFLGAVDRTGAYSFSGDVTWAHPTSEKVAALEVANAGRFTWDESTSEWAGSGSFEIVVDDDEFTTNNCTITGPIDINQI